MLVGRSAQPIQGAGEEGEVRDRAAVGDQAVADERGVADDDQSRLGRAAAARLRRRRGGLSDDHGRRQRRLATSASAPFRVLLLDLPAGVCSASTCHVRLGPHGRDPDRVVSSGSSPERRVGGRPAGPDHAGTPPSRLTAAGERPGQLDSGLPLTRPTCRTMNVAVFERSAAPICMQLGRVDALVGHLDAELAEQPFQAGRRHRLLAAGPRRHVEQDDRLALAVDQVRRAGPDERGRVRPAAAGWRRPRTLASSGTFGSAGLMLERPDVEVAAVAEPVAGARRGPSSLRAGLRVVQVRLARALGDVDDRLAARSRSGRRRSGPRP